jgi:hypothetical protein
MSNGNRHKKKAMLAALEKSLGVVTTACRACDVSRATHYQWLEKDAEYKAAVDSLQDMALDFAESKLHSQIADNNTAATIFYLKTKGKARGYIERYDVTSNEQTIGAQTIVIGGREIKF